MARGIGGGDPGKAPVNLAPSVRAAKTVTVARSMRHAGSFASDQGAVSAGVDRVLDGHCGNAPSRSYADLASGNVWHLTNIAAASSRPLARSE